MQRVKRKNRRIPAPTPSEARPIRYLYGLSILTGVAIAFVVYVIAFNHLSESTLVRLTPAWVFPLVFGVYGLVGEHLVDVVEAGKARDYAEAARRWAQGFGNWGLLVLALLLAFLVLGKWRSSLAVCLTAALFWALLLVVFFEAVFPHL